MLDGGLYQGRCIIACIFCLKKHWTMTGGLMGGGEVGGGGGRMERGFIIGCYGV